MKDKMPFWTSQTMLTGITKVRQFPLPNAKKVTFDITRNHVFWLHRSVKTYQRWWSVTESRTGLPVGRCKLTRRAALIDAEDQLQRYSYKRFKEIVCEREKEVMQIIFNSKSLTDQQKKPTKSSVKSLTKKGTV